MALIKKKKTNFGIEADYWKIDSITIDRKTKQASFVMGLYVDKTSDTPLEQYAVSRLMTFADKELYNAYFIDAEHRFSNIYQACYQFAKDIDEFFQDAIDDNDYIEASEEELKTTLQGTKTLKISEMKMIQESMINGGVNITLSDGMVEHFNLSESDQISLMGLQSMVLSGQEMIPWHTSDDTQHCKFYSNTDMQIITSTALQYVMWHTTYLRDLRIYINSLETVEDVNNITYGVDIPLEYQSEPLKLMIAQSQSQTSEGNSDNRETEDDINE